CNSAGRDKQRRNAGDQQTAPQGGQNAVLIPENGARSNSSGAGPILDPLSASATATRRPAGFAGADPPGAWPASRCRPADLAAPVDTLPGVGKTIRARLAKLGLRTVRDLLEHAPSRYVAARPISSLFGEGEEG